MVVVVEAVTVEVVMLKFADVEPEGIVMLAGTVADELLLESDTVAPLGAALPLSVTVPVAELPPITLVGFVETETSDAPVIARVAV